MHGFGGVWDGSSPKASQGPPLPHQPFPGCLPKHSECKITFQNHIAQFNLPGEVTIFLPPGILHQGSCYPPTQVPPKANINNTPDPESAPESEFSGERTTVRTPAPSRGPSREQRGGVGVVPMSCGAETTWNSPTTPTGHTRGFVFVKGGSYLEKIT